MIYTKSFKDISKHDAGTFGGKVASLGEMLGAGIPVPDGFGISTKAHIEFNGKVFSKEFKNEIRRAYKKLGARRVAVRSSAIAEDSSDASWAGQLETYLNVEEVNLEDAVRKCWKSIESENAKSYAKGKSLNKNDLLVGVAVQKMVDSSAAGVMFTANPVTVDSSEMIIESAYGLGEMVVQGAVTPDRYVVSVKGVEVTEFNISIKEKEMVYLNGKNKIVAVPESRADKASLWEHEVIKLAKLGLRIESHYKQPMDIEWAFEHNKFYIVQARPITTL